MLVLFSKQPKDLKNQDIKNKSEITVMSPSDIGFQ